MQPVHMWIIQEAIIRILGETFLPFGISLLHIETGSMKDIAENVGKKTFNGNSFGFIATTGTK